MDWVIDDYLEDRVLPSGMPSLSLAAEQAGHAVWKVSYDRTMDGPVQGMLPEGGRPIVCVGAIPLVDHLVRTRPDWCPAAFAHGPSFACSAWSTHLRDLMLNDEFQIVTWGSFLDGYRQAPRVLFVRPDDGHKTFPGLLVHPDLLDEVVQGRKPFDRVVADDMILVAPPRTILGESRFIVADGKVVTGSTYRWVGKLDVRTDVPEVSHQLAAEVASRSWQAAPAYVCDVAVIEGEDGEWEARLVELNPFSSAGLYAGDTRAIVQHVSALAERMWRDRAASNGRPG